MNTNLLKPHLFRSDYEKFIMVKEGVPPSKQHFCRHLGAVCIKAYEALRRQHPVILESLECWFHVCKGMHLLNVWPHLVQYVKSSVI